MIVSSAFQSWSRPRIEAAEAASSEATAARRLANAAAFWPESARFTLPLKRAAAAAAGAAAAGLLSRATRRRRPRGRGKKRPLKNFLCAARLTFLGILSRITRRAFSFLIKSYQSLQATFSTALGSVVVDTRIERLRVKNAEMFRFVQVGSGIGSRA